MEEQGLPGLKARYELVAVGGPAELRLGLRFEPVEGGFTEGAREAWLELRQRLAGGTGTKLPPAEAVLVTSLALDPLPLAGEQRDRLARFVSEVASGPALASEPVKADLAISLAEAQAALPSDIFRLAVRLDAGSTPIAIGRPEVDEESSAVAFAAAVEAAWWGFRGADGRLALAEEAGTERGSYWCVHLSSGGGIALASPATPDVARFAVPPLSTSALSGTVEGEEGTHSFQSIDLDLWWALFEAELERFTAAAGTDPLVGRFERVRSALARDLTRRLRPAPPATETNVAPAEVRALHESTVAAGPRLRPVIASTAVDVSRGTVLLGEGAAVLHGRTTTPAGASGGPSVSPAAVRLAAGRQRLAYALPPAPPHAPEQALPVRFEGDRIERPGLPPLRLILRAPSETDPLALDLDPHSGPGPGPRLEMPGTPALSVCGAVAGGDGAALDSVLAWSVEVAAHLQPSFQDRFELALDFEPEGAPSPASGPRVELGLFDALGKVVLFAGSAAAEPDAAAIERFAALAEAVAEALPGWQAPIPDGRALPGKWRYSFDFRDLPALIVSRESPGSEQPPPWPEVAGFLARSGDGETGRYEPEAGAGAGMDGLRFSLPGLRLIADRAVRITGRTCRNANFAGPVDPSFVYHGPAASIDCAAPWLEWRSCTPEAAATNLESALGAFLGQIDQAVARPYGLALEAGLVRRSAAEGADSPAIRIPLGLIPRLAISGEEERRAADLAGEIAAALADARVGLAPAGREEEIALTIDLFGEETAEAALARLHVEIAVPGDEAWWGRAAPSTLFR
jgi:hypothetical protein